MGDMVGEERRYVVDWVGWDMPGERKLSVWAMAIGE